MKYLLAAIIIVASIATHAAHWGFPNEVVFDEVYFGKFALSYQTHEYYFDVHPPLAKLLIGASAYLGGERPGQDFEAIGKPYTEHGYMYLRLLPILAGMLLPLILFLFALELGFSKTASFFVGLTVILENSILTNSRFILTDNLLLLFGFAGLFCYFFATRQERPWLRTSGSVLSAILLAMSLSIKWTGATFLFLVVCIELGKWFMQRKEEGRKSLLATFLIFICVPFAFYYSVFVVHFSLLTKSGPGDAFMSANFQKTLAGSAFQGDANLAPPSTFQKFIELNKVMYTANRDLTATHPYSSKWFEWPLMRRPVYFWLHPVLASDGTQIAESKIYLLGNPAIYWLSLPAVLFLGLVVLSDATKRKKRQRTRFKIGAFLVAGYFVNFLPFAGIHRAMFVYHYFVALIFSILALAWLIDNLRSTKVKWIAFGVLTAIFAAAFFYFAPFSYGTPLTTAQQDARFWFASWR